MSQAFMCVIWFLMCCCSTILIVVYDQFGISPHLPCVNLGVKTLDPPLRFFFWYGFQIMLLVSFCFCVWMSMFIFSFTLVKQFFIFQIQSLFFIKLGNILTWVNMFVICKIHTLFFALHYISFCIFIFYMKKEGINELFWPCKCW
jgi:hypothetical protein